MEVTEEVRTLCEPVVDELGVELYDVERAGGILRVTIDRPGGVSLDQVAEATRRISRLLDEHDPVPGRYTLEVTSPGLERTLRTPDHFRRAVGMDVSLRVRTAEGGAERLRGVIVSADDDTVTVAPGDGGPEVRVGFADVDRARTVFEWGGAAPPGRKTTGRKSPKGSAKGASKAAGNAAGVGDDGDDNETRTS